MRNQYSATMSFQPGTNSATLSDIVVVQPTTKPIRIHRVYLAAEQSGAGNPIWRSIRRSAANTGGTYTAVTPTKWNLDAEASTVSIKYSTAAPSAVGASLGGFRSTPMQFDAGGLSSGVIQWNHDEGDPEILIPVGGFYAINVAGLSNSATVQCSIEFSEDSLWPTP